MARHRGYNVCEVCGESYDAGERHECEGPSSTTELVRTERVDKHLEACRRYGHYVQPGFKVARK